MLGTFLSIKKLIPIAKDSTVTQLGLGLLYIFYSFQFQCFAFAGQHEFLHRNAFKTKIFNDICLFLGSVFCIEFGEHERVLHKQHHTFTNNIDLDPELTSFYTREELEDPAFRNVASSKWSYFKQFWDVTFPLKCRLGRIINSARGIPVDYSGWNWNTPTWHFSEAISRKLQHMALLQLVCYAVIFLAFRNNLEALFVYWVIPVIAGYPAVNFFRNLEHADCEVTQTNPNSLRNTRTVESNLLIRLLLWETNFHAEHHCYCMVPFYNLPKIHEMLDEHILHNECKNFTSQNWACIREGGWVDQQEKARKAK